ncbi:hypothetical protein TNCV_556391 [Trichonephila clavipes]|uniref:Uncharacterized protein n=1 Tax=Trichonephila clavipes TaxID=2585209 RepID=A0A8X6RQT8_TRICX|nr:hypothetical protein TNCV_556391 [Trichonephila clavipes]
MQDPCDFLNLTLCYQPPVNVSRNRALHATRFQPSELKSLHSISQAERAARWQALITGNSMVDGSRNPYRETSLAQSVY